MTQPTPPVWLCGLCLLDGVETPLNLSGEALARVTEALHPVVPPLCGRRHGRAGEPADDR